MSVVAANKLTAVFGRPVDEGALQQINRCLEDERAVEGALMADHHLGYSMPIGGVIAYDNAVSPSGVGFDIACGNMAVRTSILWPTLHKGEIADIAKEIQRKVEFGVGRSNPIPHEHDLFDDPLWSEVEAIFGPDLKAKARAQLGTVGSGNHYVDLLRDEDSRVWVANHFGSRGFGHTIATGFLNLASGKDVDARGAESEEATVISLDSPLGATYHALMGLAGRYAYAGREYVIDQVVGILQADVDMSVHNHHNFAWEENDLMVVRKGATPLTGAPAFIGGSMGDISCIVRGTGDDIGALASAPHGAGRTMSRTKAAGKWKRESVQRTAPDGSTYMKKIRVRDKTTAAIDFDIVLGELAERNIVVRGAGADEAPGVYKDLADVLAQHRNIEVLHRLEPFVVVMAGEDVFDPYKD